MRLRDSPSAYGTVSRLNHWLGALAVLAMLAIGLIFPDLPPGASRTFWRTLHIAIGTSLLPLVAFRVLWRLSASSPLPLVQGEGGAERQLARLVHVLLIVVLLAMLASGVLMQWFGGRPIGVFDLLRIASPLAESELWHDRMEQLHGVVAWSLMALIGVHLLGVVKHSVQHGRALWARMAGK